MKKLKLFFACLLMAVLSIGQVWATEEDVALSAGTFANGTITWKAASNGITITQTKAASTTNVNSSYVAAPRIYKGQILSFEASGTCKITQIDIVYDGSNKGGTITAGVAISENTVTDNTSAISRTLGTANGGTHTFSSVDEGGLSAIYIQNPANASAQLRPTKITITYVGGSSKTLSSVTVSGAPTKKEYSAGDEFDPAGLTVKGTYDDSSVEDITSGITWTYNPSQTLVKDQTSIGVIATVSEIASAEYNVTGLTVTAASPKITITQNEVADFAATYAQYTWTAGGVSGKMYAYKNAGMQFNPGKTGYYVYNTDPIPGRITKITMTKASGTDRSWTPYVSTTAMTSASGTALDAQTVTTTGVSWDVTGSNSYFYLTVSGGATVIGSIVIEYTEEAGPAVVAPTISGETPFSTSTTVSITHADADAIYYTTDGSDPKTSGTKQTYSVPFTVNADGTTTVKAYAVKGSDESAVASKEFEKVASYTTLADIFTKATEVGNTATDIYVTFGGWKVSAKTNNNVFLTDGTDGAVIYGSGHGFNAGDVLTGTVACKVQLYKGFAELTALTSGTTGLTVTPGSVGDPVVKTWGQLSAVNTGALVKLENLTYDGSSLSDGDNTIPTYTTFYTATFEAGKSYNLTGVYQYYDTDGQILPRSAADVKEIIETFTVTYNNAPENGTLTIKNGDDVVTSGSSVNEGTVLTIVASPAEDYKLAGVTVNGNAYTETTLTLTEDVIIAASFEVNEAPLVTSYVLSEIGVETSHLNGEHVGDKVNLPLTATECSKVFRGWSANASCTVAPEYAPGAEITLAANNKFYAVYADAHVVTPTDHALGSATFNGTNEGGNTASEGYTFSKSAKGDDKAGYIQDSGTKDATIVFLQIKAESQIISEDPSAIIVTAHLGAGANRDELTYPVNAVLVDADGANVGDPVVLTNSIPDKNGDDFSANLPTANYANVRGVKISHMKEDGWNVRYYSMSFKYQTGGTTYDNYSTECQAQVATPVIEGVSPSGVYTEAKEITITCATDDATIYYAVDSDEEPSTEYTDAFTVDTDGAHTVKAKAVKAGMAASEVASVSFTINLPLSTMDQIFAAATAAEGTATDANITFGGWVVSGVSTNGKNVFVTDGTKGFIIFDNGGEMGFAVGDVLSGTVACKVQLYKGAAELTTLSSTTEGLNIAKEGVITPAVKAITALSGINTGAAVTINSVQFDGTNLSDGANNIKPFNSLFAYDALENGKYYNVTGIYQQFDATKEILPRSAADIQELTLDDPELSYDPVSVSLEVGQALSAPTFNNPHTLSPISYSVSGDAVATVTNEGVIALVENATGTAVITASFAGNAQYAPGNATFTITVTPASVSENVVVLAEHNSKFYAMTTTITNETAVPVEVEYDGTKVTVAKDADKDAIQWTKKTIGDGITFQTKDEDKLYLKGTSGGGTLALDANVCNWSWDETHSCYVTGTRGFIYRISTNGFKNYAVSNLSNADYVAPQVIAIDPENIVISSKVDPELAYTPASDEITVGDAWSAPVLGYVEGFDGLEAIIYESSNEAVATVTDAGVIALAGGTGTATITATYAGNASYLAGSATYTVKVNEAADVCDGTDDFLDTEDKGNPTSYTDRSTPNGWSAVNAGYKVIEEKAYWMINGKTTAVGVITSPELTGGLGSLKFRYANTNSESNGVSVKIEIKQGGDVVKEYTLTKPNSDVVQNTVYTELIENINVEGTFQIVITNLSPSNNTGNKDRVSIGRFCWSNYSAPEPPTPVYTEVRGGLTAGNYYTICLPKKVTAIKGATFWNLEKRNSVGTEVYLEEAGLPFAAGTPFIINATADKLEVVYEGDATSTLVESGALRGTLTGLDVEAFAALTGNIYILKDNAIRPRTAGNWLSANRAYILYNELVEVTETPLPAPGKRVIAMPMQKDQAQGFENLDASEKPLKVMIDGTLYILRGEKVYDATGRLVK